MAVSDASAFADTRQSALIRHFLLLLDARKQRTLLHNIRLSAVRKTFYLVPINVIRFYRTACVKRLSWFPPPVVVNELGARTFLHNHAKACVYRTRSHHITAGSKARRLKQQAVENLCHKKKKKKLHSMRLCGQVDVCAPLPRVQTSTAIRKYVHTAGAGVRGVAAKQLLHLKTCAAAEGRSRSNGSPAGFPSHSQRSLAMKPTTAL